MANIREAQQEALATIDAAKVLVDKVLSIFELISFSPSLSVTFATNPIGFLLQLLEHLGVTYEELRDWLTNFIIYIIPLLEVSVKSVMLTNLKNMISCTADPRIPEKYRKQHKVVDNYNTSQEYGIDISLESIDFYNKLLINPLSKEGKDLYFGLDGVKDVYKFARAEDFDAFLWFIMHKGKFPNSSMLNTSKTFQENFIETFGANNCDPSGGTLLDSVAVNFEESSPSRILPGNTFTYKGANVISLCIESLYGKDNKITKNTLVPVSDDWNSVNWYTRRGDYLTSNLGIGKKESRDYNKECGICNIQFLDQASTQDSPLTGLVNNKFRFTILPKPYVHVPNISAGEPPWRFKKLLFNSKGEYDPKGKYTFKQTVGEKLLCFDKDGNLVEKCKCVMVNPDTHEEENICVRKTIQLTGLSTDVYIDVKSGNVIVSNPSDLIKDLFECYPGLTVYEFNYDYVMGMKLFDAKAITTTLLDSLQRLRMGINTSIGYEQQSIAEEVKEIIKNIVESDEISIEDCFFEFSNEKYDALLKNAEEKRARKNDFTNVKEILNELKEDAELHEQVDILNRAITQATLNVIDGVNEEDKISVRFNLVTDLIEQLTLAIVMAILSPKVLMLFEVNETIMGGKWQKITVKDLIKSMKSIIVSIIKEVRDLIIQELTKLVLKLLSPIVSVLISSIAREQIENYTEAIDDIIRNCPRIWFKLGTDYSDTKLDTVDYADIIVKETKEGESPKLNNC